MFGRQTDLVDGQSRQVGELNVFFPPLLYLPLFPLYHHGGEPHAGRLSLLPPVALYVKLQFSRLP